MLNPSKTTTGGCSCDYGNCSCGCCNKWFFISGSIRLSKYVGWQLHFLFEKSIVHNLIVFIFIYLFNGRNLNWLFILLLLSGNRCFDLSVSLWCHCLFLRMLLVWTKEEVNTNKQKEGERQRIPKEVTKDVRVRNESASVRVDSSVRMWTIVTAWLPKQRSL